MIVNVFGDHIIIAGIVLVVFWLFAVWFDRQTHLIYRLRAARRLKRLARISDPRRKFGYLKATHHFVFEEMILTALKRKGHKVIRNKRYTGDGGIDGQAMIHDERYFIQAKRYREHINPAHVTAFARICHRAGVKGLFVHTGKTGPQSRITARTTDVVIISGARLLRLFAPARAKLKKTDLSAHDPSDRQSQISD